MPVVAHVFYKGTIMGLNHRPPGSPNSYSFPGPKIPAKISRPEDIKFYQNKEHFEVLFPMDMELDDHDPEPVEEIEEKPVERPKRKPSKIRS